MLIVKATLPPPGAGDVTKRDVTIAVTLEDGTVLSPVTTTVTPPAADFTFAVARNASVTATQIDTDAAGNPSAPTVTGPFIAKDTFPPPAPGQLGLEVVGQDD